MASSRRSSSSNSTSFHMEDNRMVSDNRNWNDYRQWDLVDNSSRVLNMTDGGAINAATQISRAALEMGSTNTQRLIDAVDRLSARTQTSLDYSSRLAQQMSMNTVDIASGNKTVMIVAMGIIGAVAVINMR